MPGAGSKYVISCKGACACDTPGSTAIKAEATSLHRVFGYLKNVATGGAGTETPAGRLQATTPAQIAATADALRLYAAKGYAEVARRPVVKGDWQVDAQDWILMVKPLA